MERKIFIKELDENQIKTLIVLGLAECDRQNNHDSSYLHRFKLDSLEDLNLDIKERDDSLYIRVIYAKNNYNFVSFDIDDFSMIIRESGWEEDLNYVLKTFLASIFYEDYINHLNKTRLNEINNEREILLKESSKVIENYGPRNFANKDNISKHIKKEKTKSIGII